MEDVTVVTSYLLIGGVLPGKLGLITVKVSWI